MAQQVALVFGFERGSDQILLRPAPAVVHKVSQIAAELQDAPSPIFRDRRLANRAAEQRRQST